jgi:hypothetical protein
MRSRTSSPSVWRRRLAGVVAAAAVATGIAVSGPALSASAATTAPTRASSVTNDGLGNVSVTFTVPAGGAYVVGEVSADTQASSGLTATVKEGTTTVPLLVASSYTGTNHGECQLARRIRRTRLELRPDGHQGPAGQRLHTADGRQPVPRDDHPRRRVRRGHQQRDDRQPGGQDGRQSALREPGLHGQLERGLVRGPGHLIRRGLRRHVPPGCRTAPRLPRLRAQPRASGR